MEIEMQDKPKRSRRPAVVQNGAAPVEDLPVKVRKPRVRKGLAAQPVEVPSVERLDTTIPLPALSSVEGSPTHNGGMTVAHPPTPEAPRRIVCQGVEAAYLSDVGRVRSNNQDSASAFLSTVSRLNGGSELLFGLLVLADGMGGHESGEVASNIAVRRMNEGVIQQFYVPTMEGRPPGRAGDTPLDLLRDLIEDANQSIVQEAHQNRIGSMGTTLTCAVVLGQTALIGHVGDSRLYVLEKGSRRLQQVTHDHSVVQRLVDTGQMTPEEAANSPQRSMLWRSLGQKGQIDPDVGAISLNDVEYMLLCSDGLWDMVEDAEIERILQTASDPAQASATLVETANANGGDDNVTVVVARF